MSSTSDEDEEIAFVFDNGSSQLKAGFAGDESVRAAFSCITGRSHSTTGLNSTDCYISDQAQMKRELLSLKYPIEHGIVTNWDDMEKVWHHAFYNELRTAPDNHPILLTEPVLNPKCNREKMAEVMFETFNSSAIDIALQPVLAILSSGRVCGISLDLGEGVCSVLPMYEGRCPSNAIMRSDFAGRDCTDYLMKSLSEQDYSFSTTAEHEIVRDIKERCCYVALDFEQESKNVLNSSNIEKPFSLPDGQVINIKNNERFTCPEILFQPFLFGRKCSGIHKMIYNSLMKCHTETRRELYGNICVTGGTTMFSGFDDRLLKEMTELLPAQKRVRVIGCPERKVSVWIGGSILASLSSHASGWISKEKYMECGPSVMLNLKSCF